MTTSLTAQQTRLKQWMTLCSPMYLVAGLVFALAPGFTMDLVHISSRMVGLPDTPASTERFWLTLAVSMMMMLTVCCALVARDVVTMMPVCLVVVVSKFTSTLLGILYFAMGEHHGALIVIGTTDFPLGVVTLILWLQAKKSV